MIYLLHLGLLESGNTYIRVREEERTKRTALKPTCGRVISSESYIRFVSVKGKMVNCVMSDVVLQLYRQGPFCRRVLTVAKSTYWLRQLRHSVHPHASTRLPLDGFSVKFDIGDFY